MDQVDRFLKTLLPIAVESAMESAPWANARAAAIALDSKLALQDAQPCFQPLLKVLHAERAWADTPPGVPSASFACYKSFLFEPKPVEYAEVGLADAMVPQGFHFTAELTNQHASDRAGAYHLSQTLQRWHAAAFGDIDPAEVHRAIEQLTALHARVEIEHWVPSTGIRAFARPFLDKFRALFGGSPSDQRKISELEKNSNTAKRRMREQTLGWLAQDACDEAKSAEFANGIAQAARDYLRAQLRIHNVGLSSAYVERPTKKMTQSTVKKALSILQIMREDAADLLIPGAKLAERAVDCAGTLHFENAFLRDIEPLTTKLMQPLKKFLRTPPEGKKWNQQDIQEFQAAYTVAVFEAGAHVNRVEKFMITPKASMIPPETTAATAVPSPQQQSEWDLAQSDIGADGGQAERAQQVQEFVSAVLQSILEPAASDAPAVDVIRANWTERSLLFGEALAETDESPPAAPLPIAQQHLTWWNALQASDAPINPKTADAQQFTQDIYWAVHDYARTHCFQRTKE